MDSDDESVIAYGKKRKVNKSPKKTGKCKSRKDDDGGPECPDMSGLSVDCVGGFASNVVSIPKEGDVIH